MYQINSTCSKLKCSLNDQVPTLKEISLCLGPSLAQLFFDYSHGETKRLLKLSSYSEKCAKVNDQLGDNASKLLTHDEIIKAELHENILELGQEILEKFETEIEESVRWNAKIECQEKFCMYQAKIRREVTLNTQKLHTKYENYIKTVQDELAGRLKIEWADIITKCNKDIQKAVVAQRINVVNEMLQKLQTEICYIIESLYRKFQELFYAEKEKIISDFNEIMRKEHVKLNKKEKEFEKVTAQDLHIQRHEYEIQNTVDVLYVLCLERLHNSSEKHAIHSYYKKQCETYQSLIISLNKTLNMMKEEIVKEHTQRKLLEEEVFKITKQFQNFIDFTFHSVPGQSEFLLPLGLGQSTSPVNNKEEQKNNRLC